MQNGFVESFNGQDAGRVLERDAFRNLAHARDLIAKSVTDYNTARPIQLSATNTLQASPCT